MNKTLCRKISININAQLIRERLAHGLKHGDKLGQELKKRNSFGFDEHLLVGAPLRYVDLPALFLANIVDGSVNAQLGEYTERFRSFWDAPTPPIDFDLFPLPAYVNFVKALPRAALWLEHLRAQCIQDHDNRKSWFAWPILKLALLKKEREEVYHYINNIKIRNRAVELSKPNGPLYVAGLALLYAVLGKKNEAKIIVDLILDSAAHDLTRLKWCRNELALTRSLIDIKHYRDPEFRTLKSMAEDELEGIREYFWTEPKNLTPEEIQPDVNATSLRNPNSPNNSNTLLALLSMPELSGRKFVKSNQKICADIAKWFESAPQKRTYSRPFKPSPIIPPFHKLWPWQRDTCRTAIFVKKWVELEMGSRPNIYRWTKRFRWLDENKNVVRLLVLKAYQSNNIPPKRS